METTVNITCKNLDATIEKANRLVELLREAQQISITLRQWCILNLVDNPII